MTRLLRFVLLAVLSSLGPLQGRAADNSYDTLGKVLMPFLQLFAEKGPGASGHAVDMVLRVEQAEGSAPELAGAQAELALEAPDHVKLSAPLFGSRITLCRRGDTVWVSPGSALRALLERPEVTARLPEPNRDFTMKPFRLPLPTKQLVFLPVLFQAREAEPATIDGKTYRGIDFKLMPELARSLKVGDWSGSVWVDENTRPVRFALNRPETQLVLRFNKLVFSPALPPETWAPTKEEEGDVLIVPPARYDQLMRAMMGERAGAVKKKEKKKKEPKSK